MNKEQLAQLLLSAHQQFILQTDQLNAFDFCYAPAGKWSAAQQLDHIVKSVRPVNMAMWLPKIAIQLMFGKANRPSKTYDELVAKYKNKLAEGYKATGAFVPAVVGVEQKAALLQQLTTLVNKLCAKTTKHSEQQLDAYILPHPLLGKLTLREMLYFTAYHVQHHSQLINKGLQER